MALVKAKRDELLAPLSAVLIRLAAAFTFGYIAAKRLRAPSTIRGFGIVEGLVAVLLFIGLYTQAAAILGVMLALIHMSVPRFRILPTSTVILIAIMCLSLLVTGPGPFTLSVGGLVLPLSLDLPL